jgi:GTP-binding protein
MLPTIAIVGRPNVGKSTLFNRLAGTKKALVHDRPGVTRDRNYAQTEYLGREFMLVDTGGYDPSPNDALFDSMRTQSDTAMAEADVILFLVDRQAGITPADLESANRVRSAGKPVVVVVNKCDTPTHEDEAHEFWSLGFDELVPISAEHARGIHDLMEIVFARLPVEDFSPVEEIEGEIRVAVLGRPNIGKSTLLNKLLGQERHVVHDMPGTTMDSTDTLLDYEGTRFRLVDTAGIRRRGRISDRVETIAVSAAIRTIERCHVLMLVIDGAEGVTDQDAALAELIEERGRAVVLLINKWDMVREMEGRNVKVLEDEVERRLPHLSWAPVLYISALTGKGCGKVLSVVRDVYASFNQRVATAKLNDFLRDVVAAYQPPQLHNHPVRLQYMTQVRVRPPTFTIFCNNPDGVLDGYQRYLQNKLREQFGFLGTPLRLQMRRRRKLGEERAEVELSNRTPAPLWIDDMAEDVGEEIEEDLEDEVLEEDAEEGSDDEGSDDESAGEEPFDVDEVSGDEPDAAEPGAAEAEEFSEADADTEES